MKKKWLQKKERKRNERNKTEEKVKGKAGMKSEHRVLLYSRGKRRGFQNANISTAF